MRMYDIIVKKRDGEELSTSEINYMIEDYVDGEIPDYQMSSMLMAIYYKGMTDRETLDLTKAMASSGDIVDLSSIDGIKVDKHSTGGVGDKTSLVITPIIAACGVKVAKMSGKGLGHTGGTIDKLESIKGFRTDIEEERFFNIVNEVGCSIIGQSKNIAPADGKLYALRDTTGTVESIPLITSSIMSKKLAAGSDCILLDVKMGSGAFMKTLEDATTLAKNMVSIGENAGKKVIALITDMDIPLGNAIGNSLEVIEAIEVLKGEGSKDLTQVCKSLASNMLVLAGYGEIEKCMDAVEEVINNGKALEKLAQMVKAQGGNEKEIYDTTLFKKAKYAHGVLSEEEGYIVKMDTDKCGIASMILGAGREKKEDKIDYLAGIILDKKTGDYVKVGEQIATLYTNNEKTIKNAETKLYEAYKIGKHKALEKPHIYAKITKDEIIKNY